MVERFPVSSPVSFPPYEGYSLVVRCLPPWVKVTPSWCLLSSPKCEQYSSIITHLSNEISLSHRRKLLPTIL